MLHHFILWLVIIYSLNFFLFCSCFQLSTVCSTWQFRKMCKSDQSNKKCDILYASDTTFSLAAASPKKGENLAQCDLLYAQRKMNWESHLFFFHVIVGDILRNQFLLQSKLILELTKHLPFLRTLVELSSNVICLLNCSQQCQLLMDYMVIPPVSNNT